MVCIICILLCYAVITTETAIVKGIKKVGKYYLNQGTSQQNTHHSIYIFITIYIKLYNQYIENIRSCILSSAPECNGKVILSSFGHTYKVAVFSRRLYKRNIKKRRIVKFHPESKTLLNFEVVTFTGNCCWKIYDSYVGGQAMNMDHVSTYQPGWPIRKVELFENCNL